MSSDNPKPCPFCGKLPKVTTPTSYKWVDIWCDNGECGVDLRVGDSADRAIKIWNTRVHH